MTQNMYLGADFSVLPSATTPAEFVAAVTQISLKHLGVETSEGGCCSPRNRERASRCHSTAEVWILRTGSAPATDVKSDQLEALLGELRRLGQRYEAVAILPNLDLEAPTSARLRRPAHGPDGDHCAGGRSWTRPEARKYAGSGLLENRVLNTLVGVPLINKRGCISRPHRIRP